MKTYLFLIPLFGSAALAASAASATNTFSLPEDVKPNVIHYLLLSLNYIAVCVGVFASTATVIDLIQSTRLKKAKHLDIPFRIRRAVPFKQFMLVIRRVKDILDDIRFIPDYVVGVHYSGLSMAAMIGRQLYKPVLHTTVHYATQGNGHTCTEVKCHFHKDKLKNKKVLIVDNGIQSGNTLRMVYDCIYAETHEVKTFVVYQKTDDPKRAIIPDIVLFSSKKPLETLLR